MANLDYLKYLQVLKHPISLAVLQSVDDFEAKFEPSAKQAEFEFGKETLSTSHKTLHKKRFALRQRSPWEEAAFCQKPTTKFCTEQHSKADDAPITQKEDGEPFADIVDQNSTWWTPIGKKNLLKKKRASTGTK